MKFFLEAFVAVIAVVSGAYLPFHNNLEIVLAENELVQLIRDDLNILSKIMKYYEPFLIPHIPDQHIEGKDINLDIDLKDVKIIATDDSEIDHTEKNKLGQGIDFGLTIPKVLAEGQYKVSGVVRQIKVNGSGNFKVHIDKLVINGTVRLNNEKPFPKLEGIIVNYDLEGVKCDLGDLSIKGFKLEEMTELLNTKFYDYLQSSKKDVYDVMSRQFVQTANKFLEDYVY